MKKYSVVKFLSSVVILMAPGHVVFGNLNPDIRSGDALIVFRDDFSSSGPQINLVSNGWVCTASGIEINTITDRMESIYSSSRSCGVELPRQGEQAIITLKTTYIGDPGAPKSSQWLGFGFTQFIENLTSSTNPSKLWVNIRSKVSDSNSDARIILREGSSPTFFYDFSYTSPVEIELVYDRGAGTVTVKLDGNIVLVDSSLSAVPDLDYATVQFSDSTANAGHALDDFEVHMQPRRSPLRSLATTHVIEIGPSLESDTDLDDAEIQQALDDASYYAAIHDTAVEVRFHAGSYYEVGLKSGSLNGNIFTIDGASNLWINGNGSTIEVKNLTHDLFFVTDSENIIFDGFANITSKTPPFMQTTIQEIRKNDTADGRDVIVVTREAGFPNPLGSQYEFGPNNENFFTDSVSNGLPFWGYAFEDKTNGRMKTGAQPHYFIQSLDYTQGKTLNWLTIELTASSNVEARDPATPNNWTNLDSETSTLTVGDPFAFHVRWGNVFRAVNSKNITVKDVTVEKFGGMFLAGNYNDAWNLIRCSVVRGVNPNTGIKYWKTVNGDFALGEARTGIWMEDCFVESNSDDVLNQLVMSFVITSHESGSDTMTVKRYMGPDVLRNGSKIHFEAGDSVSFLKGESGELIHVATVSNWDPAAGQLTFSSIIPGTVLVDLVDYDAVNDVYGESDCTLLVNNSLNSGFVIRGNTFSNPRGHIRLGSNGQMYNNDISGHSRNSIRLFGATSLKDTWMPGNGGVIICNNDFSDCGFAAPAPLEPDYEPIIDIYYYVYGDGSSRLGEIAPDQTLFSDIYITENTFSNWRYDAIYMGSTKNSYILRNTFNASVDGDLNYPIYLDHPDNVYVDNIYPYLRAVEVVWNSSTGFISSIFGSDLKIQASDIAMPYKVIR